MLVAFAEESLGPGPITEQSVSALEAAARSGDKSTIRKLFAFRARADGAAGEALDILLGSLVKRFPKLFLEELQFSQNTARLDSLLGNLGPAYADQFTVQTKEIDARIAALKKVSEPGLLDLRNQCLRTMQQLSRDRAALVNRR